MEARMIGTIVLAVILFSVTASALFAHIDLADHSSFAAGVSPYVEPAFLHL